MLFSNFLYRVFLLFYRSAISLYSLFNKKARKWIEGRHNWEKEITNRLHGNEPRIWFHCSSLGEFEQGRPLIESLRDQFPGHRIILTFFSPSGFEHRKDDRLADFVFYLPIDGKKNAQNFIRIIRPALVVFVKYEFWYFYLRRLDQLKIPVVLISAAFRESQPFFKWYGKFFREMLGYFSFIFVQDEESLRLLQGIHYKKGMMAGDTRYDRVKKIARSKLQIPGIEQFQKGMRLLIGGSTWPEDELLLQDCLSSLPSDWKLIIAPHEIDPPHLRRLDGLFPGCLFYSALSDNLTRDRSSSSRVLIIDNIGLLSSLYAYGDIAFVGGGFQKSGIHNVLEPAVFGLPLIFGPAYQKFVEARQLVSLELAFPVVSADETGTILRKLTGDQRLRSEIHESLVRFIEKNTGATNRILNKLLEENWLKSLFLHS
jgi:3-deoxy-D-manno-octulosonic-acid transferase